MFGVLSPVLPVIMCVWSEGGSSSGGSSSALLLVGHALFGFGFWRKQVSWASLSVPGTKQEDFMH